MPSLQEIVALLETSATRFTGCYADLPDAAFRFKPAPDVWSIAENVDHLVQAESRSGKLIRERMLQAEAPADLVAQSAGGHERIGAAIPDRNVKVRAPEFILPAGQWGSAGEMTAVFEESRRALIEFLRSTSLDLSRYVAPHPLFGPLNGYQWAHATGLHTLRHVAQIEEVKAAPGYPAT
ncbi:MAG: DinB family protein [Gemmatimonadales bacterium]